MTLRLMRNTQFIYELALAQMELAALAGPFQVSDDFRTFTLRRPADEARLLRRLAYFDNVDGQLTDYARALRFNQTRSINQYLTHWIYPYKGKFHPQLVRALLNVLGLERGETVLDPFVGSGTTLLEARLLGIHALGFDVSPLCVLVSQVKANAADHLAEIEEALQGPGGLDIPDLGLFTSRAGDVPQSTVVANFRRVAYLIALSDAKRRRRDFTQAHAKNLERMLRSVRAMTQAVDELGLCLGRALAARADARRLPLADNSVHGIITSPPYSVALDYVDNDQQALLTLGWPPDAAREHFIGLRGKAAQRFDLYVEDMTLALAEMFRVLAPGRGCALVVGNVVQDGQEVDTTGRLAEAAQGLGFHLERTLDKIIYGLYNVISREYVLFLRKP